LQTLAFPGAYSTTGLIGDGVSSASWLFVLWHGSFDLAIIAYVLSKHVDETVSPSIRSSVVTIGITIAMICGTAVGLTWVVTEGAEYLPTLNIGTTRQTWLSNGLNAFLWLSSASVVLLVYVRRRTLLDLWLIVILLAWWPHFVLSLFLPVVRFTLGWYVARVFALISSSTLLILLLIESMALSARLASAILLSRRERADRLMSVERATSAIIHEVRQPLTGIDLQRAAALRWLGRVPHQPDLDEVRQCLNSISAAGLRAEEIMSGVRALFRPIPNRRMTTQLNDLIRETLSMVQHDLQIEGISVTTKYDVKLPQIKVDRTQIQQVMFNLIKNSIEAMQSVPFGHLQISTGFDGNSLVGCYIQDTGPGVAAKDRDRMFEPFFTTKRSGTGLGLPICCTIVERHGGILRLAKTDSCGSSFEVAFPVGTTSQ
jgi:signal transduction histidine kinase